MIYFIVCFIVSVLVSPFLYSYIREYCDLPQGHKKVQICIFLSAVSTIGTFITLSRYGINAEGIAISIIIYCALTLSVIDINCYEIPILLNMIILICSGILFISDYENVDSYLIGCTLTSGIFLMIYLLSKGEAIGGGDVKLMICAGLGLGLSGAIVAFLVSFVSASIIHLAIMKFLKKGNKLAFGPYMAIGIVSSHLYGDYMANLYINMCSGGL